jgi:hypothetical protein
MRDRRALIASDIAAGLRQRLGDGQNSFAAENVPVAQFQVFDFAGEERSAMTFPST